MTSERTDEDILKDIEKARDAYVEASENEPGPVARRKAEKVKELQAELSAYYAKGAKACPKCKNAPHGMDRNGSVYEVGCLVCPPFKAQTDGKDVRRSYSAHGRTPEKAVANWNAGVYLEDDYLNKIPH
jgi:hypothetical protein